MHVVIGNEWCNDVAVKWWRIVLLVMNRNGCNKHLLARKINTIAAIVWGLHCILSVPWNGMRVVVVVWCGGGGGVWCGGGGVEYWD